RAALRMGKARRDAVRRFGRVDGLAPHVVRGERAPLAGARGVHVLGDDAAADLGGGLDVECAAALDEAGEQRGRVAVPPGEVGEQGAEGPAVSHVPTELAGVERLDELPQRSEEHTSELQSRQYLVCRLLLE